jgi:vancomycin permeability regulator SanA
MVHITYQFGGGDPSATLGVTSSIDCAIVFGAAVHYGNEAGPGIYRRVETAAELYHEGNVHTIFLTGGKGSEKQDSEALVMQRLAMRMGVDLDDLILEDQATSTWENLLYTRGLVEECSSVVGISDRYHLARIQYLAELQEWGDFRTLPATTIPPFQFELRAVTREAFGLVYYTLSQYIDVEKYITPVSR